MRKKLLWVLVLLTVLLGAVNICSASDLSLTAEEFYSEYCRMAEIVYDSPFCATKLERTGEGFIFKTAGGYKVKLYTKSLELNLRYAKIYFSLVGVTGKQLWAGILPFFLAADNNLDNLTDAHLEFLEDYIMNLLSNRGKIVYFDRIQMYYDMENTNMYYTAFGR